ncbi:substrate-binding domain-containing protein [Tsukamurella pseudospumae]|uniref:substrate-binding domain-containing protein n=1 Tax=Tsukamurella pseudospumae TaxID=239498 RepID=UPI000AC5335F|nr:substrate-binding domain-containing protein [Tsukamurella pseudospumae]
MAFLLTDAPMSVPFARFRREVTAALQARGFTCVFIELTGLTGGASAVWQHLQPAVVISTAPLPEQDHRALTSLGVKIMDGALSSADASIAGLDQRAVGRLQVRHLAERGHRKIGFAAVEEPQDQPFCLPRLEGAREQCRELGLAEPAVEVMDYSLPRASAAVARWHAGDSPVSAVAAYNDTAAVAILGACRLGDLAVPGELAVVGVDDEPIAALTVPPLTTIAIDLTVSARALAASIVALALDGSPEPTTGTPESLTVIHRESS